MRAVLLSALIAVGAVACNDVVSCQNACQRAYRNEQCNIRVPGQDQTELIRDCSRECEVALRTDGELGGYNPDDRESVPRNEVFVLDNEKQAAVWMDCVMETACEDLNDGFCPGGGIN